MAGAYAAVRARQHVRADADVGAAPGVDTGRAGQEWGSWFELVGKDERLKPSMLPFFTDTFKNTLELLPKGERGQTGRRSVFVMTTLRCHI